MSLRQCDGPDLDELLARAAREHGPSARVVKAEKVRRGGVGGFFAREWFELSIEVPDGGAADIDSLAEATEDVLDLSVPAAGSVAAPIATCEAPPLGGLFEPEEPDEPDEPADLPSTEQSEFEALLASLTGGPRPQPLTASETAIPSTTDAEAEPQAPNGHQSMASSPALPPSDAAAQPAGAQPAVATPAVRPLPSTERNQPAERRFTDLSRHDPVPPPGTGSVAALARAGLPRDLVTGLAGRSPAEWSRALDQLLPPVPGLPQLPGSIVAVVGTVSEATRLARELSRRTGGAGEIHLLSRGGAAVGIPPGMVLPDAAAVDERARRFARSPHPVVVAVAVDGALGITRWLAAVVGRLRPDQTWLCADAAARPDDVSALADVLGGVDVLTVNGTQRTTAPATLLTLQLPVALLDDDPSVGRSLAALLRDRVDDPLPDQIAVGVTGQPIDQQLTGRSIDTAAFIEPFRHDGVRPATGAAVRPARLGSVSSERVTQRRAAAARIVATDDAVARLRGRAAR